MNEQEIDQELRSIGRLIKKLLPDYHGYVQFNLVPKRQKALITKHETVLEEET